MSFTDPHFFPFLLIAFTLWSLSCSLARGHYRLQVTFMLAASLLFYAHDHHWVLAVLFTYAFVDWAIALWLQRSTSPRAVLTLGVSFNLALLCFYKYTPLLLHTLAPSSPTPARWIVPMGISFYSFTGIAYMVDVFRRRLAPEPNFPRYLLFTSFFPHLVAGPILRGKEFLPDLSPQNLPTRPLAPLEGTFLLARGFAKKLLLADTLGSAIDPFFANITHPSTNGVWSLPFLYLYAAQIYFDFSGYTDIARGLGLWFGFRWPENFNNPYLAPSVTDFWRRWHMTLSRFLRDYLYIPLGGNRHGPARTALHLLLTLTLGGLWHGASFSFLLWGLLHGLLLLIHRAWSTTRLPSLLATLPSPLVFLWRTLATALTFTTISLAWSFFRLTTLTDSLTCLQKVITFNPTHPLAGASANPTLWLLLATYLLTATLTLLLTRNAPLPAVIARTTSHPLHHGALWALSLTLLTLALLLAHPTDKPTFIYFQF